MKKRMLAFFVCSFVLEYALATIEDDWKSDAELTKLLQRVEKLKYPFFRTMFDTLINKTVTEVCTTSGQTPKKIMFLNELLLAKIKYSCMTDTDISDVGS